MFIEEISRLILPNAGCELTRFSCHWFKGVRFKVLMLAFLIVLILCISSPAQAQDLLLSDVVTQKIATSTFESQDHYILSAWVNPGTGSALIGFASTATGTNEVFNKVSIHVTSNGITSRDASSTANLSIEESGYVHAVPHPGFNPATGPGPMWYRIYIAFKYTYDPDEEDETYIYLQNNSPDTASYSVWFDGIQLERQFFEGQIRPTSYSEIPKIVSPNRYLDLSGHRCYCEW